MNNKLTLKSTDFETEMENIIKEEKGNNTHGTYDFYHNFSVYNKIIINNEIELYAVYQTGNSYLYNDYDCPNPDLELSEGTSKILCLINNLTEVDIDDENEEAKDVLNQLKDLCPAIDNFEKLIKLHLFLNDNKPHLQDYI